MDFTTLQHRLIARLRERVRSGEATERGLAKMTGASQPHLHNVLKGKRSLSIPMADHVMRQLNLDVLDLFKPEELQGRDRRR